MGHSGSFVQPSYERQVLCTRTTHVTSVVWIRLHTLKTLEVANLRLRMKDMKGKVWKIKPLHRRLRTSSLSHIVKYAEGGKGSILQYSGIRSSDVHPTLRILNQGSDEHHCCYWIAFGRLNSPVNDATSNIPSKTSVTSMQSQDHHTSAMAMRKNMDGLLPVFGDLEQENRKCTIHWLRA